MNMNSKSAGEAAPLDPVQRFALAYAPRPARKRWHGLFALETRLADAARPGREPFAVQLRLAWWRDRFGAPAAQWPAGEPLLALLGDWDEERPALAGLVDGWEAAAIGEADGGDGGAALLAARVEAMAALDRLLECGEAETVRLAARDWTMPHEAGPARALPRAMRPLAVLRGLAVREARGTATQPVRHLLAGMRIGIFGR